MSDSGDEYLPAGHDAAAYMQEALAEEEDYLLGATTGRRGAWGRAGDELPATAGGALLCVPAAAEDDDEDGSTLFEGDMDPLAVLAGMEAQARAPPRGLPPAALLHVRCVPTHTMPSPLPTQELLGRQPFELLAQRTRRSRRLRAAPGAQVRGAGGLRLAFAGGSGALAECALRSICALAGRCGTCS